MSVEKTNSRSKVEKGLGKQVAINDPRYLEIMAELLADPYRFVLYEDSDILAIDKPAPLITDSPDITENLQTLANILYKKGDEQLIRAHRLDAHTTGVVLFSKNKSVYESLYRQFEERKETIKQYVTIVEASEMTDSEQQLTKWLDTSPYDEDMDPVVVHDAPSSRYKQASHEVIPLKRFEKDGQDYQVCLINLHSGRTHQIRAISAHMGYPVVGDRMYNPSSSQNETMLHSFHLRVTHPRTNKSIDFRAPIHEPMINLLRSGGISEEEIYELIAKHTFL